MAFFGLGRMGLPMSKRLIAAGFAVAGCDQAPAAQAAFRAATSQDCAADPGQAAGAADVVITMLPDGAAVRSLLVGEGDGGLLPSLRDGTVVVDMSSSAPMGTRPLGAILEARGVRMVDAPVSGGVRKAVDGTLAIMAGGDPAVIEGVRPLLLTMGASLFLTGPLGSGHALKALNNFVSAAGLVAALESVAIGRRFGLAPEVIVDVLNASTGRNNSTENKLKQFVLSGSFASGFSLALMAKDIATADDLARDLGLNARLLRDMARLWAEAREQASPAADHTEIARYIEATAATET